MAAPLVRKILILSAIKRNLKASLGGLTAATPLTQQVCGKQMWLGKARKRGPPVRGKQRGPKKIDGEFVYKGEVLVKQLGLTHYPGENVGIQKNNTLYALRDGIVVITCEELSPYPDSPLYERVSKGLTIYKQFWNIYPTPVHAKFKLVTET